MTVAVADITKAHFYHSEHGLIDRRQLLLLTSGGSAPLESVLESTIWGGGGFEFYVSVGGSVAGERTGYDYYDTFTSNLSQDNAGTDLFLANIVGSDEGVGGWNAQITPTLSYLDISSFGINSYYYITIAQDPNYDIATNETVTITVPSSLLESGLGPLTASFTITEDG